MPASVLLPPPVLQEGLIPETKRQDIPVVAALNEAMATINLGDQMHLGEGTSASLFLFHFFCFVGTATTGLCITRFSLYLCINISLTSTVILFPPLPHSHVQVSAREHRQQEPEAESRRHDGAGGRRHRARGRGKGRSNPALATRAPRQSDSKSHVRRYIHILSTHDRDDHSDPAIERC